MTMLSYHNDPAVKAKYIARFAAHRAADEVAQGHGYGVDDSGFIRGCFIGCTLNAYAHERFPGELGWPTWLAHVADSIFEELPAEEAPQFGADLLEAVPIGVDIDPVQDQIHESERRLNRSPARQVYRARARRDDLLRILRDLRP